MGRSVVDEDLHDLHVSSPGSQVDGEVAFVVRNVCRCLVLKELENYVPEGKRKQRERRKQQKRKEAEQHTLYWISTHAY